MLRAIGYLWAAPVTLAGLLLACGTGARFAGTRHGMLCFVSGPWLRSRFFDRRRVAAFTWGAACVFAAPELVDQEWLLLHESEHTRQAMKWGPLMPLAYGAGSLWARLRGGDAYRDNPMEVAARKHEKKDGDA